MLVCAPLESEASIEFETDAERLEFLKETANIEYFLFVFVVVGATSLSPSLSSTQQ